MRVHERRHREALSEFALAIYDKGWVANHDGNVSVRLDASHFLITRTAESKRRCSPETHVVCDLEGRPQSSGRPPSEVALHIAAYRRADVQAVMHAHPVTTSAFALAGVALGSVMMPEVCVSLGQSIPLVKRYLPKDPEVAAAVSAALQESDVAVLAGNGGLSVGPDLETAFLRLELLEHYASIVAETKRLGLTPAELTLEERVRLYELRKRAGLVRPNERAPTEHASSASPSRGGVERSAVEREVRRLLGETTT